MFELPEFNAYQLFQELRDSSAPTRGQKTTQQLNGGLNDSMDYQIREEQPQNEDDYGFDDKAIFCYFKVNL